MNEEAPTITRTAPFDLQVCIPASWSEERVKQFADREHPAGTDYGWRILQQGHKYLGGDPPRVPCSERAGYVHVRLEC